MKLVRMIFIVLISVFFMNANCFAATGSLTGKIPVEWFNKCNSTNCIYSTETYYPFNNTFYGQQNMDKTTNGGTNTCATGYEPYHDGWSSSTFKVNSTEYTYACAPGFYTITLNQQGGSGGTAYVYEKYDTGWYKDSGALTQITTSSGITVPTRTGYAFGGYYTGTDGSGTQILLNTGKLKSGASTTTFSANGTLYAKWTANTYTITYKKPDPLDISLTGWANYTSLIPSSYDINTGTVTLPSDVATLSSVGHTFGGWYTSCVIDANNSYATSSCSGNAVTSFSSSDLADKVFYAKQTPNTYTVSYKCLSTDASFALIDNRTYNTQYFDGLFREYSTVCPSSGYSASQWTCTYGGTTHNITPDTNPAPDDATWQIPYNVECEPYNAVPISYTITYNTNGGALSENNITEVTANEQYTQQYNIESATITLPTPTKPGYTFDGWYEASNFSGIAVATIPTGSTGDKTYYAKWTENIYTFTLDENSTNTITTHVDPGTVYSKYSVGMYSDANATQPITELTTTPVQTGYVFEGFWTTQNKTDNNSTKIINANGEFLPAAKNQIPTSGTSATWFAQWFNCEPGISANDLNTYHIGGLAAIDPNGLKCSYEVTCSAGYHIAVGNNGTQSGTYTVGTDHTPVTIAELANFCEANIINLTWNPENGDSATTNTCQYATMVSQNPSDLYLHTPIAPNKSGHTFMGWEIACSGEHITGYNTNTGVCNCAEGYIFSPTTGKCEDAGGAGP